MSNLEAQTVESHHASVFAALGDATRLQLIHRLTDTESLSIKELSHGLPLSRQGVTKHLKVLQQAGMIQSKRQGREQRFTICPEPIKEAEHYLSHVSRQWEAALSRLQQFIEDN